MPVKVVENKGASVMFVGGKMIFPGAAELVDVPEDAEPELAEAGAEPALDGDAPMLALLEQGVAKIVPVLAAMTDEELARLEALESAGMNRKWLLSEVTVERLKRAAGGGDATGGDEGAGAEGEQAGGDETGSAGDSGAGEDEAG